MNINIPIEWLKPSNLKEAQSIQYHLSERLILKDDFASCQLIGGMDVSNNLFDSQSMVYASAVVLNESLIVKDYSVTAEVQTFPYIPGFLGFREAPALVNAFKKLKIRPDILLVDGHGISHPRGLGIASHIGVLLDIPTIGVAKSILVGTHEKLLNKAKGSRTPLIWNGKEIGVVLRTKTNCKPLIISAGHRISIESAIDIVMNSLTHYKLPEPTRQAHLTANQFRRKMKL